MSRASGEELARKRTIILQLSKKNPGLGGRGLARLAMANHPDLVFNESTVRSVLERYGSADLTEVHPKQRNPLDGQRKENQGFRGNFVALFVLDCCAILVQDI